VIKGHADDPSAPHLPVTVHDIESRRLRYQTAPRDALAPILNMGGMAKYSAIWRPEEGTNGLWQLVDILPDDAREVA
jgi:hypothetical protein